MEEGAGEGERGKGREEGKESGRRSINIEKRREWEGGQLFIFC